MATGENTVFRGMEGTGAAQIFGREGNPMRAYQQRKGDVERKRAFQAEQGRLAKEQRDKKMWEMVNVDPEATFQPFNRQVMEAADGHRKKIVSYFENGGNPNDPAFQMASKKGWDEVNDLARRSNYIKKTIEETQAVIEKNPFLQKDYYFPKIWDMYMDEKGNGKSLDQVDPVAIQNVFVSDPLGFNETEYRKKFMDGLNENMTNYISQKSANNGILTEDHETKWKGGIYTPDPENPIGVKTNPDGTPVLNVTPELVNSYTNSETAKRYYDAIAKRDGKDMRDVVADQFRISGGLKQDVKASFSKDSSWMMDWALGGGLNPEEQRISGRVFEHIDNIANAFWDKNGNRTNVARPEAREAVGHLKGSKYGSGTIMEAEVIPGTNKPGKTSYFGKEIENSPNDRLLFKVKSGTRGITSVEEVNITDEGAPAELWNQYLSSGYMGKKSIAFDKAAEQLKVNPRDLYKGREYVAVHQQKEQASINAWAKGEDIGQLTSKTYKGTPIVGVSRNTSWGNFKGLTLTLSNGEQVSISKDDYDQMTEIYRGDNAVQPAGKKSTGVNWE